MCSQSRIQTFAWPVILASASPRRQDLLREIVPEFEIVPAHITEEDHVHEDPWETAQRTAREKALAVSAAHPKAIVIAGDTVVAFSVEGESGREGRVNWTQLAKPLDENDAFRMLRVLSGRTHTVVTGVCVIWPEGFMAFTEATEVTFKPMSDQQIMEYVATGDPMDKAGAYGFQGGARPFVDRVEGSVTNVIGLPMEKLTEALKRIS